MEASAASPPSALPGISPTRREIRCRSRSSHRLLVLGQGVSRLPISPLVGEMPGRAEGGSAAHHTIIGALPC
ncbi:propionyl-coenzyme A carboxylase alpha polypeptide [Agrobacterium tumefaciens]|nr:propionyl-coenzyme A carboxylase alpha polypeptide [Agrobacterium tumefaciens]